MKQILVSLVVVACALTVLDAGGVKIKAQAEPGFEFSGYSTYAWAPGTSAAYPEVQQRIVAAVERELEARGMKKAEPEQAQLRVSTHAFANMEADITGRSYFGDFWGVIASDARTFTKGTLWIKLMDAADKPMWQAAAGKAVEGPVEKLVPKIDGIVERMFDETPARKPVAAPGK